MIRIGWRKQPSGSGTSEETDTLSSELEMAYLNHKQPLLALALNITKCQSLAEDAIQIAFSRLVQKTTQADDLKAYVFQTVRNSAIDIVRKRKQESSKVESVFRSGERTANEFANQPSDSQLQRAIQSEEKQTLQELIDRLPEDDREIILLKVFSGFTFEKVAEITRSNTSTVATRYRRLLEKLKSKMKADA